MNKFKFSLLIILLTAILISCSKNDDEIVREFTGLQMSVDKIGSESNIGKKISKDFEKISKQNFKLNLKEIERSTYSYLNNIQYFLIPFSNQENKSLGFYSNGITQIYTILESEVIDSENTMYRLFNIDYLPLYSFIVNSKEGIMKFEKQNSLNISALRHSEYPADFDCGTLDFGECMDCGFDVCSQDWRCQVASTLSGPFFVAGLAITCGLEQIDNP